MSYKETLQQMLEVSGSIESYQNMITQGIDTYREKHPEIKDEIWDDYEKEFTEVALDDLVDMLIPVYQKYLEEDELEKVIEFYQTKVGKKYASNMSAIFQESYQIGQQWGQKWGKKIDAKVQKKLDEGEY